MLSASEGWSPSDSLARRFAWTTVWASPPHSHKFSQSLPEAMDPLVIILWHCGWAIILQLSFWLHWCTTDCARTKDAILFRHNNRSEADPVLFRCRFCFVVDIVPLPILAKHRNRKIRFRQRPQKRSRRNQYRQEEGQDSEIQAGSAADSQTAMVVGVWSLDGEGCMRKKITQDWIC